MDRHFTSMLEKLFDSEWRQRNGTIKYQMLQILEMHLQLRGNLHTPL